MTPIRTTHTGSLPRPPALVRLLGDFEDGAEVPELEQLGREAVRDVLARQIDVGLDLVNDGEQAKPGYSTYVRHRLSGFDGPPRKTRFMPDFERFPDFGELAATFSPPRPMNPSCSGPIALKNPGAVRQDVAALKDAAARLGVADEQLFMTAASPGVIALFFASDYHRSREQYLGELVEAMRDEYRTIVEAGILLQLDCPDFAMARHSAGPAPMAPEEFREHLALSVAALNAAVEGLDPSRMRLHLCWSNTESPHYFDIELREILDVVLRAAPAGLVIEASNPRHAHEWKVFEEVELPEDKYVVAGVIDTTTNFVEHPELVAQRLMNYTRLLGAERVLGGTDCGFGTFADRIRVAPRVVWEKLRSLVQGAELASRGH
jgi:5-methyltetrahydropteroyltriglutamate--homocysteine methyltransferase